MKKANKPAITSLKEDLVSLKKLREIKPAHKKIIWKGKTKGEVVSDWLTMVVGSWKFILTQAVLLVIWIFLNIISWINAWDPYPFILLNLVLSFQAAFTAPIIMMSQNRQNVIDRQKAENDYNINIKAELEIELLHQKIDSLKDKEMKELIDIIRDMEKMLNKGKKAKKVPA